MADNYFLPSLHRQ
jgi:hypothetical protein